MKKIISVSVLVTIISSCNYQTNSDDKKEENSISLEHSQTYDLRIEGSLPIDIHKFIEQVDSVSLIANKIESKDDEKGVILYHIDNHLLKVDYNSYSDGVVENSSSFYFDENNFFFSTKFQVGNVEYFEIYFDENTELKFTKVDRGLEILHSSEELMREEIATAMFTLNNCMKEFPNFKYDYISPSEQAPPILTTFGEGVDLFLEPKTDSEIITSIPARNKNVRYLGTNGIVDKVDGKEGIWYKVEFDNSIGWVFGDDDKIGSLFGF